MKNSIYVYRATCLIVGCIAFLNCTGTPTEADITYFAEIEKNFKEIPSDVETSIYWYWLSDNISKEGIVKDLEAMKRVGITRAFIGNIGLPPEEQPYGNVKIFTDEWWEAMHLALKKATELDIEIGLFNSPGWSQSGGPWISTDEAMRYLAITELQVKGPCSLQTKLEKPTAAFQDVKLLAFPYDSSLEPLQPTGTKITSLPEIHAITAVADGNSRTVVELDSLPAVTIDFELTNPYTVRSVSVLPAPKPIHADVELWAKNENTGAYVSLKKFNVNRVNDMLAVGFNQYGPVVVAIPETASTHFRVILSNIRKNSAIAEISLSAEGLEERYVEKTLAKMFQWPWPSWDTYLWEEQPEITEKAALVPLDKVIDITTYMDTAGNLAWEVPEGNWKIVRSGMAPTGVMNSPASPEAVGLEVDKMSKKHIASHFDAYMGEFMRRIPAEDRKSWKVVVQDSYEMGGQNWTDRFIDDFKARYNYDPVPFIPAFNGYVVGSRDITDRFLWDLRRLVADKIAYDYVGGLREVSHKHGFTNWLENYGHWGFPGEFLQYGGQSDAIGGEFWAEDNLGLIENRAASSCGHIYGKKKIYSESFTAGGKPFARYPGYLKMRGDRFFTEGINSTLLHVYIHQPYEDKNPGMNASFSSEFNRKNTWFDHMDIFIQYLKRCNYMLQQGNYVADAAYFIGEDTPKMIGVCDPELPKGYSFDYINAEVLLTRTKVKDGYLVLPDGMRYKVLVLANQETMRPKLLKKITELVEEGAVVLGPRPIRSPSYENYPEADREVRQLSDALWGDIDGVTNKSAQVGKGLIASGMEMQELFDLIGVLPDFRTAPDAQVLFIHRTQQDGDSYFISNQSHETLTICPDFRITGRKPERWDPVTGATRELPAYTLHANHTAVPLQLEPSESTFIVFRHPAEKSSGNPPEKNYPAREVIADFSHPWTVTFDSKMRGPVSPVEMDTLQDWTQSPNDSIKYYAGTAIYQNKINFPAIAGDKSYYLDLGKVMIMAKVTVNGQYAGGVWTAPWRVDISKYIRKGENTVEISVVNNWMNRLIGDSKLPEEQRETWCPVNPYKEEHDLQSSGLIGPVVISSVNY